MGDLVTRRLLIAIALWTAAAAAIAALAGTPAWSVQLYSTVATQPLLDAGRWISQAAVLGLVALYAATGLWLLSRRRTEGWGRLVHLVVGGAVACLAYGANLVLKNAFTAIRPCHLHEIGASCPPLDNWSFPSNHTVIAFSLMIGLVTTCARLAWAAVPTAVLAGCARVLAGDHYPHDVLAGAVFATLFCLGLLVIAAPRRAPPAPLGTRAPEASP